MINITKTIIPLSEYIHLPSVLHWHFKEEFDLDYNHRYKFLVEKHDTYDGLMEFVVAIA